MISVSPVSRHNQMTAKTETSGNDAINAPNAGLRFAVSATTATITPEIAAFVNRQSMMSLVPGDNLLARRLDAN